MQEKGTRGYLRKYSCVSFQRTFDPPNPVLRLIEPKFELPSPRSSEGCLLNALELPAKGDVRIGGCARRRSQSYAVDGECCL
jgi:hypothetical protein